MLTIENIGNMLDLLEVAYGKKNLYEETTKEKKLMLWETMFAEDDPVEVLVAVKNCIATLQFPPKVADIKKRIADNKMAGQMTEMEVWSIIRKAVEEANSRENAKKVYEQLPKIIQRTVGSASQLRAWRAVEDDQFETVIASNCMRSYRILAQREAGYYALPADMQQAEAWRIDGPAQKAPELPEPPKLTYEKPEWMVRREEERLENVNPILSPMTDEELKRYEARQRAKETERMNRLR